MLSMDVLVFNNRSTMRLDKRLSHISVLSSVSSFAADDIEDLLLVANDNYPIEWDSCNEEDQTEPSNRNVKRPWFLFKLLDKLNDLPVGDAHVSECQGVNWEWVEEPAEDIGDVLGALVYNLEDGNGKRCNDSNHEVQHLDHD